MDFDFATAQRIRFAPGVRAELPAIVAALGRRALVVTGSHPARHRELLDGIAHAGVALEVLEVPREPTTGLCSAGVERARDLQAEVVVAIGGGSAIDAGKAVAALLTNGGEPLDYLEVVGRGRSIVRPSAPFVAVPTTAGTGAEVTRNAVLTVEGEHVKVSLRSPHMLPRVALVDPQLTAGVPPAVTASTGLDALTQVLEPFVCNRPSPLTDALCREALPRAARALPRAFAAGGDADAREDMSLVSLIGGLALANARLGAVHGLAGPLGGMTRGPHGALCASLLTAVMVANVRALRARAAGSPALGRYEEVARLVTGNPAARIEDAIEALERLRETLAIPRLAAYGVKASDIPLVAAKGAAASSTKGNPVELTKAELAGILEASL